MKNIILIIACLHLLSFAQAQDLSYLNQNDFQALFNEQYGEFERNKFDIILPTNSAPHGLVIYIHGGGFVGGDKKALYKRKADIKYFIDHNIAVATINYRFRKKEDGLGVRLCLQDVQSAIQYLRFNAVRYNIDKSRVACYGASAGAGSSLYFAFQDDLAVKGDTTLLGESTRLKCAGAIATQATYDVFRWKKFIPHYKEVLKANKQASYDRGANFYGYPDYKSHRKAVKKAAKSLDMLDMIDAQDPPIYLMNLLKKVYPKNNNIINHHKSHAIAVSVELNKHQVENYLYTDEQANKEKDISFPIREFLVQNLK